jgi:hypothetical protein
LRRLGRDAPFEGKWCELLGNSATLRCQIAGSLVYVQSVRGTTRASLVPPLRFGTKLAAVVFSGRSGHNVALGVELEQSLQRRSYIQISQRIGSAANPGGRADETVTARFPRAHLLRRLCGKILSLLCKVKLN